MRIEDLLRKKELYTVIIGVVVMAFTALPAAAKIEIADISITDAVENELFMDPAVPSYQIDVSTAEGIVTLSGSVDSLLAKERAARIARIVKGVRAVVNEIKVEPPVLRSDWQIREDVGDALLTDPATDSYQVDITVKDNRVTLSGSVDSWQEKKLCGKVAKGVKGVKEVVNDIVVFWEEDRPDHEIKAEVGKALKWDAFVDHALIDVRVENGKVMLSGVVGSAAEKSSAFLDAYVTGVKSVDNSGLKVERWARDKDLKGEKYVKKSEQAIENAVKDALYFDPRVSGFNITPEVVRKDRVILRGTVDNLKAKRAAAQDARNTVGVVKVENRIKVRPAVVISDEKVEDRIRKALKRDPYVDRYEITVGVVNGVANLYGNVDSYFEKSQADEVASRVNGVVMVDNNLIVQEDYGPYTYDPYVDDRYFYDYDWYHYEPTYTYKSDREIKEDIQDELWWSPFVDSDDVTVMVEDGEATLTGTVDSWSEYTAAQDNAYEGGAVYVDNELAVR